MSTNPTFRSQSIDVQLDAVDRMQEKGWIDASAADQAKNDIMDKGGPSFVSESISGSLRTLAGFFIAALFIWLAARLALKDTHPFAKHLELYGLSILIGAAGGVVTLILMVGMDTIYASPSAGIFVVSEFDPMNRTHQLLSMFDVFGFWQTAAIGFGFHSFSQKSIGGSLAVAFSLFVLWILFRLGLGLIFS